MNVTAESSFIANGHGGIKPPWFSLLVSAAAVVLFLLFGPAPESLVFDREAIGQGEWWRLITGHLVHSDFGHAQWDIMAFAMIAAFLEQIDLKGLVLTSLLSMLTINGWIWLGMPDMIRYAGLSGIINALFPLLLYRLWQLKPHPVILIIATCAGLKLALEVLTGQALFTNTLWPSVPLIHLIGLITAMLFILSVKYNHHTCKISTHSK